MPKFAANLTMMFHEVPFLERFGRAAAAGFKGVECTFPYDHSPAQLAELLEQYDLTQVVFNLPPGNTAAGECGLAALPGREGEFYDSVEHAIEYALALGCLQVHVMAGRIIDESQRPKMREQYLSNLRYAARCVAEYGLTLLIEPINTRTRPGYFLNYQVEAHVILTELNEPNLKVTMDFFHMQIMDGDLAQNFKRFQAAVGHVQIAGVPDRHEPNMGEVNYPYLLQLLDDCDYEGWVGCEYRPRGLTEDGLGWLASWK